MQSTKLVCPECHRKFEATSRPFKVSAKKCSTPEDQEKKPQLSEVDRKHLQELVGLGAGHALMLAAVAATPRIFQPSQSFECPWCRAKLSVMTMVILANPTRPGSEHKLGQSRIPNADNLGDQAVNLALNAFGEAVREQARLKSRISGNVPGIPKDMLKFFGKFLRWAMPHRVHHSIVQEMQKQYPHNTFQVWRAEGVALVTRNDELFRFLPAILLEVEPPAPANEIQLEIVTLPTTEWVKSKHGYIPAGNKLFMGELRRKSKGSFSKPTQ